MQKTKIINISQKQVNDIQSYMPADRIMRQLADFFSVFSDTTRIKILSLLSMKELCVSDISEILNTNQTTVSHQLKILRANNIVKYRRNGKTIYYSLLNKQIDDIMLNVVNCVFA